MDPLSGGVGAGLLAVGIGFGLFMRTPPRLRGAVRSHLSTHSSRLDALEERLEAQAGASERLDAVADRISEELKTFSETRQAVFAQGEQLEPIKVRIAEVASAIGELTPRVDALGQLAQILPAMASDIDAIRSTVGNVAQRTTMLEAAWAQARDAHVEPTPAIADPWSDPRLAAIRSAAAQMETYAGSRRQRAEAQFAAPAPPVTPADVAPFIPTPAA